MNPMLKLYYVSDRLPFHHNAWCGCLDAHPEAGYHVVKASEARAMGKKPCNGCGGGGQYTSMTGASARST